MSDPAVDAYAPCPCGSGQKYKFCCRDKERESRREILRRAPSIVGPDGAPIAGLDLERAEALHVRAAHLLHDGRGQEAIAVLEKAIRAAPMLPHLYNNLALAQFLIGDVRAAIQTSERVDRAIDPVNTFALGNLVHFHLVAGDDETAERTGQRLRAAFRRARMRRSVRVRRSRGSGGMRTYSRLRLRSAGGDSAVLALPIFKAQPPPTLDTTPTRSNCWASPSRTRMSAGSREGTSTF